MKRIIRAITRVSHLRWFSIILMLVFVVACQGTTSLPTSPTPKPTSTFTPTLEPTATSTIPAKPTPTLTPTPEPEPTLTPAPEPTATLTEEAQSSVSDPLFIESLRQYRSDPPSTIEIVSVLAETDRFTQYQIAYLSDGLRITGIMNVPVKLDDNILVDVHPISLDEDDTRQMPVILLNHGHYTPTDYYSGKGTELESAYLARHGYVTIASDYRGYADSEGTPGNHFDPGWTHDILNLLDALPSLDFVDTERVGIWGHSTGGEIALQVITARNNVDAVVLFGSMGADAIDNLALVQEEWGGSQAIIQQYGLPSEAPEVWAKLSPITYLADVSTPISIHHGKLDHEVPPELSARLWQAMQAANVAGEYFTYPDQGHFFAGRAWILAMERTLVFFDKYVKD